MSLTEKATPKARVLAYVRNSYTNNERKFVEIKGFRQVSTNITTNGSGTATVTFPNYKSMFMRFVDLTSINDRESQNQGAETTNDLGPLYINALTNDVSHPYFSRLWDDLVLNRGDKSLVGDLMEFNNVSRSRGNLIIDNKKEVMSEVHDAGITYAFPFIDLFDPIFIDYMGQDGLWYAGFTGLVTRISDSYARTGDQSLTLQCRDYSVLLDNVSLITAWNRLTTRETQTNIYKYIYGSDANADAARTAFTDIFSKYNTVEEIILNVIKTAQEMWRLDDYSEEYNIGVKAVKFDTTEAYEYHGISARRGSIYAPSVGGDPTNMNPDDFKAVNKYEFLPKHYMWDTQTSLGNKKIFLDPLLKRFDNVFIHKLLTTNLELFKDSMKSADQILSDLAAKMLANRYFDANGNLIIELPKPNALPDLMAYGGRSQASAILHEAVSLKTGGPKNYIKPLQTTPLIEGIHEAYDWSTLFFHGSNYVLSSDDFVSFNTTIDEAPLYTIATMGQLPPYLANIDVNLQDSSTYYRGVGTVGFDMLAKLGVRRYQMQTIYNAKFPDKNNTADRVLSYQSAAILERVNSAADSGTCQLLQRPELQLGRTFILPTRMKSYVITGINNTWAPGSRHTTTLTLSYGHPIHKTLEVPWSAVFAEPHVFGFDEPGDNPFSKVTAVDAKGNQKPLEVTEITYISPINQ